ncbi:hypothetical protein CC2G_006073 [Coprinopsis cinerea AmutBmut pab1-1]|nr:hypothetical protein CC2G_006073 [Coprinopsis cinerea AmutBmut pab1-1]
MSAFRSSPILRLCRSTRWPTVQNYAQRRWSSSEASTSPKVDGPAQTETNKAEITMKRFWKEVGIGKKGDDFTVTLDKRALKTPSGNTLLLPSNKGLVAALIAAEWDHQETLLKPHALPMTSIVSRAIDSLAEDSTRQEVEKTLLNYLETDTVCFFHDDPEPLHRLQTKYWVPLIDWARSALGLEIAVSNSVLSPNQPRKTIEEASKLIRALDRWELAALERATIATKSLIIGLALVKKHLTVEGAALAASVEVDSQIERWGEVEDTHDVDYQDRSKNILGLAEA